VIDSRRVSGAAARCPCALIMLTANGGLFDLEMS
jgi:hypothetical protein